MSIPVFIAHGIEEYLTGFTEIDPIFAFVFRPIIAMNPANAGFVVFQVMIGLLLFLYALFLFDQKWLHRLLIIPGILYVLEGHHIVQAIIKQSYYSGTVTALLFPVLAVFFWRKYVRTNRQS
ncbi:MAG TPA: hypothetical protein VI873_02180 [Candidatus Peribacteraceae bacterium]|nr:hypothetical protein [Candidatus Peribacteraceae bacterium]